MSPIVSSSSNRCRVGNLGAYYREDSHTKSLESVVMFDVFGVRARAIFIAPFSAAYGIISRTLSIIFYPTLDATAVPITFFSLFSFDVSIVTVDGY